MILLDLPHSAGYFLSLFAERGLEPLIRHHSTGFETVRALVAAGEGFAVLNQRPLHDTTYTGQGNPGHRKADASGSRRVNIA
jgi:DNA-binding transcriptional LysR family regulator